MRRFLRVANPRSADKICFINLQTQQLFMPFSLFGKKEENAPESIFCDRTFMTGAAKMNACLALAKEQPQTLFICWFADTVKKFKAAFLQAGLDESRVIDAKNVHSGMLAHKTPVFAEHYPLQSKELVLVEHWNLTQIPVYSAMDEALFLHFGSEKMIPVMKMMGNRLPRRRRRSCSTKPLSPGICRSSRAQSGSPAARSSRKASAEW